MSAYNDLLNRYEPRPPAAAAHFRELLDAVVAETRNADAESFERYPWHSDGAPYDMGRDAAITWVVSTLRRRAETGEKSAPAADVMFFRPGHAYAREHHGSRVEFRVSHVDTAPDGAKYVAFGWRRFDGLGWEPSDSDDLTGWADVTEAGVS